MAEGRCGQSRSGNTALTACGLEASDGRLRSFRKREEMAPRRIPSVTDKQDTFS